MEGTDGFALVLGSIDRSKGDEDSREEKSKNRELHDGMGLEEVFKENKRTNDELSMEVRMCFVLARKQNYELEECEKIVQAKRGGGRKIHLLCSRREGRRETRRIEWAVDLAFFDTHVLLGQSHTSRLALFCIKVDVDSTSLRNELCWRGIPGLIHSHPSGLRLWGVLFGRAVGR